MRITLKDAKVFLAPFVGTGLLPTNPKVVDGINEAVMFLMNMDAEGTLARIRFWINNGQITMPREVQTIRSLNVDDYPVNVFNKWYEFMNFGPGTNDTNESEFQDAIDLGDGFCTHSDPSTALQILITPDVDESSATIRIMGLDENGREVYSDDGPGEAVAINHLLNAYSTHKFSQIYSVVKPITNGYVYLSAYDPSPLKRYNLATYHPDETNPCYRRYWITSICRCATHLTDCSLCAYNTTCVAYANCMNTASSTTPPYTCTAMVKLRYIPASHDTDVLLIQNLPALKRALQALRYYDAAEIEKGAAFEALAKQAIINQTNDITPLNNTVNVEPTLPTAGVPAIM